MARQITIEVALAAFRKKVSELVDANVLLEAQVKQLEEENERLRTERQGGPDSASGAGSTDATAGAG